MQLHLSPQQPQTEKYVFPPRQRSAKNGSRLSTNILVFTSRCHSIRYMESAVLYRTWFWRRKVLSRSLLCTGSSMLVIIRSRTDVMRQKLMKVYRCERAPEVMERNQIAAPLVKDTYLVLASSVFLCFCWNKTRVASKAPWRLTISRPPVHTARCHWHGSVPHSTVQVSWVVDLHFSYPQLGSSIIHLHNMASHVLFIWYTISMLQWNPHLNLPGGIDENDTTSTLTWMFLKFLSL